ncbi:MAG: helix-turn-helix domain-containing protein [Nocardioidaceae bacterium]|nr:helix-turn-helix domain-containing protein [Nocardioidaceae bacterium]
MADDHFARRVTRLGALADPIRRALYRFVAEQPGAVSRDQAAEGIDVPRHTAKFHLDRLVEEGLLVTEFRRLTGRSGPGAGRPAKLYRRSRKEVTVSLPSRRYDLAGQVLADAVERSLEGTPMAAALADAAANAARVVVEAEPGSGLLELLEQYGYEPRPTDEGFRLGNCPYDRLAADHRGLICPLNRDFVGCVARETGRDDVRVEAVEPVTGCCVRLTVSSSPA